VRIRLGAALATAIVLSVGLITLLGLLVGDDLGPMTAIVDALYIPVIADIFVQLAVITIAVTVAIGIFNLLNVHVRRLRGRNFLYSLTVIVSFLLVVGTYALQRSLSMALLEEVQVAVESALAALLLFALVYGAYRVMHRRVTWSGILFVLVLLIVLIGAIPGLGDIGRVSNWLMAIPVSAGARGILLGIALATIVTGVRVLIGQDRSYRE
jgi:hypothetical protein